MGPAVSGNRCSGTPDFQREQTFVAEATRNGANGKGGSAAETRLDLWKEQNPEGKAQERCRDGISPAGREDGRRVGSPKA